MLNHTKLVRTYIATHLLTMPLSGDRNEKKIKREQQQQQQQT